MDNLLFQVVAVLGALAWLPPIIGLVRKHLQKPHVRIITQKAIEIGYTMFGPIANLSVAFSTSNKDVVISNIEIKIRHELGEERVLSWRGLAQHFGKQTNPMSGQEISFGKEQSVLAMKLTQTSIEERLIRFQDEQYHSEKTSLETTATRQLEYLKGRGELNIDSFLSSQEMQSIYSFFKNWSHWKQGRYEVIFSMNSPEPFDLVDNHYQFELSLLDIESLEKNKALIETCYENIFKQGVSGYSEKPVPWNWRYPSFVRTL